MKKGYDIGQFQRSGEISLHFWNLANLGVEIDYLELKHWYGSKMAFKTPSEAVTPPPRISYPKKTHQFGVTNSTSGGSPGRAIEAS